jgi:hypothetical protein
MISLFRRHRARLNTRLDGARGCIVGHKHIDAHRSKQQKHNGEGADPHHAHLAFFGVWVRLIGHRGFLLGSATGLLCGNTPLPGYSRALLTSGASSSGATVICNTHPGGRSIEGGGPKSLNAPGPGCHQRVSEYGLHLTGVTASGVPALELIQPVAVRRHGHRIAYGAPRPSVTWSVMSSSNGALSIGCQS